ncbi:MAG: methylenetetrahydrofolate--tRNA-(uracil(54)-C(5))-methyltransferase (FADH(2)-oxidizing) TrmFO [Clostridiaceae bacterium]|jgi:methylenetetrahydrofolate--tRNA-(uracil-5-)-methyltransferase|nr:methylenetetrahydrofolate--tRNA-(uracil(54)-C(5))-methyltransferase (FADH(2)-oxidizing) TrmFO [Clostridiaceae bacterium]
MSARSSQLVIVGAGLAGSEAALTAARLGAQVKLVDMKPAELTPAHNMPLFAELVCSNSLKSNRPETAQGLLKRELRSLGSKLIRIADQTAVAAGGSLSVDRDAFAGKVTAAIREHPSIQVLEERVDSLDSLLADADPVLIATGPLTAGGLYDSIQQLTGSQGLHFYDAVAPIVDAQSIDYDQAFYASRYDKGGADYLNCPLSEEDYKAFRRALLDAERAPLQDFDRVYFKDCLPIEVLAERGEDTMRFGPLRPVGLIDPRTGKRPYACLQLRRESGSASMWSLVGCQTRLTFPEQRRVFGLIPALRRADFFRYGVMHRNSFLKGPAVLGKGFQSKRRSDLFFAGQLTGLEGYVEAITSGLLAGTQAAGRLLGLDAGQLTSLLPPKETMSGALAAWVTEADPETFQPMNANFGLLPLEGMRIKKKDRPGIRIERSDRAISQVKEKMDLYFPKQEAAYE